MAAGTKIAERVEVVKIRAEALGIELTPEEIEAMAWAGVGLAAHEVEIEIPEAA